MMLERASVARSFIPIGSRSETMIWRRCGVLVVLVCAGALGLGGGCGSPSTTSSTAEATVHGTVKLKGKLLTSGKVFFNPSNVNRKDVAAVTAEIGKDGTYTIKTLVGRNVVSVSAPETVKDPVLQYNSVTHNFTEGDSTYDIDVTPP
jgi:hypothetical protein